MPSFEGVLSACAVLMLGTPLAIASQTVDLRPRAEEMLRAGESKAARDLVIPLLADPKQRQWARLFVARTLLAESDCVEAVPYLQQFLKAEPSDPDALGVMGACLFDLGRTSEAEQSFLNSLKSARSPQVLKQLAALYLRTGRTQEAESLIAEALAAPDAEILYLAALLRYSRHDYDAALQMAQSALTKRSGYIDAQLLVAQALTDLQRYDDAEWAYRAAIQIDEQSPGHRDQPYVAFAQLLVVCGRKAEAAGYFEKALKLNPQSAGALLGKARLLYAGGRAADSLPFAEAALRESPDNDAIHAILLKIYLTLGMADRAGEERKWLADRNARLLQGKRNDRPAYR